MSDQILVYLDEGVGLHSFRQLIVSLHEDLAPSSYSIKAVNHRYLIQEDWEENTALVVIPGGQDVYYHNFLQGAGNKRISTFVSNGGSYLGICAGGYYGSAYIEFERGGKLEVCAERELAFFPGRAIGPAYGLRLFSYESERGARPAQLSWQEGLCHVYFNGGCLFAEPEAYSSTKVLARYHDLSQAPAAVVKCQVGEGRAILCGTHPEYEMHHPAEPRRRAFWNYLLDQSLIKN